MRLPLIQDIALRRASLKHHIDDLRTADSKDLAHLVETGDAVVDDIDVLMSSSQLLFILIIAFVFVISILFGSDAAWIALIVYLFVSLFVRYTLHRMLVTLRSSAKAIADRVNPFIEMHIDRSNVPEEIRVDLARALSQELLGIHNVDNRYAVTIRQIVDDTIRTGNIDHGIVSDLMTELSGDEEMKHSPISIRINKETSRLADSRDVIIEAAQRMDIPTIRVELKKIGFSDQELNEIVQELAQTQDVALTEERITSKVERDSLLKNREEMNSIFTDIVNRVVEARQESVRFDVKQGIQDLVNNFARNLHIVELVTIISGILCLLIGIIGEFGSFTFLGILFLLKGLLFAYLNYVLNKNRDELIHMPDRAENKFSISIEG